MSRIDWLPALVVGLILVSHSFDNAEAKISSQSNSSHSAAQPNDSTQPLIPPVIQTDISRVATALEAKNAHDNSTEEKKRDDQNLEAQKKIAIWAGRMFWVGLAEIIATFIGVFLIGLTLQEAKRSADAAKTQLDLTRESSEDQLRPYFYLKAAGVNWSRSTPCVLAYCRNDGQTPATFFEIQCLVTMLPQRDADGLEAAPPIPNEFEYRKTWPVFGGKQELDIELRPRNVVEIANRVGREGGNLFFFIGRIVYGDIFGATYETEFAFFTAEPLQTQNNLHKDMKVATGRLVTFRKINGANQAAE